MRTSRIGIITAVVVAATAAATALGTAASGSAGGNASHGGPRPAVSPPSGDDANLTVAPGSGLPGTVVTISNSGSCYGDGTATVVLHDPGSQTATQSGLDGSWSVHITVAAGTPAGTYQITASC